ncbi:hypothetical protein [Mesorhizobium sp. B2-1-3A]|uniref:hypothetical protein n=1 Tax=Mesorhizobium sp. B2-1-3A TaxID=2589971 RepID=UPI00112DCD39|nr:hypothetical protein [Mesorhizobium sp. B2-1-3A]TPM89868.1 hypothetical protein FJ977_35420 [Mesorhizobium sp. B2-1-3A]
MTETRLPVVPIAIAMLAALVAVLAVSIPMSHEVEEASVVSYRVGDPAIQFNNDSAPGVPGWFAPDDWGMWGNGNAELHIQLQPAPTGPIDLTVNTMVKLSIYSNRRMMALFVNGKPYDQYIYDGNTPTQLISVTIPQDEMPTDGKLVLRFVVYPGASPDSKPGFFNDGAIGVGLRSLQILPHQA